MFTWMSPCLATTAALAFLSLAPSSVQAQEQISPKRLVVVGKQTIDLLKILDRLTEKHSEPLVRILRGAFKSDKSLVLANQRLDVSVSREMSNWRGCVKVTLNMPANVHYSVDVSKLRKAKWDPQRKILTIVMPPLEIHTIEAVVSEKSCERTFPGWLRYRCVDSRKCELLEDRLFREDYTPAARYQGEQNAAYAANAARESFRRTAPTFLRLTMPDIEVVVE